MRQKKQGADGEKKTSLPGSSEVAGAHWLTERKCPECGKSFCVVDMEAYVYKNRGQALCSWHCMRAVEKRQAEKEVKRRIGSVERVQLTKEQVQQMTAMAEQGKGWAEIGRAFGVNAQLVRYHVQKARTEG